MTKKINHFSSVVLQLAFDLNHFSSLDVLSTTCNLLNYINKILCCFKKKSMMICTLPHGDRVKTIGNSNTELTETKHLKTRSTENDLCHSNSCPNVMIRELIPTLVKTLFKYEVYHMVYMNIMYDHI